MKRLSIFVVSLLALTVVADQTITTHKVPSGYAPVIAFSGTLAGDGSLLTGVPSTSTDTSSTNLVFVEDFSAATSSNYWAHTNWTLNTAYGDPQYLHTVNGYLRFKEAMTNEAAVFNMYFTRPVKMPLPITRVEVVQTNWLKSATPSAAFGLRATLMMNDESSGGSWLTGWRAHVTFHSFGVSCTLYTNFAGTTYWIGTNGQLSIGSGSYPVWTNGLNTAGIRRIAPDKLLCYLNEYQWVWWCPGLTNLTNPRYSTVQVNNSTTGGDYSTELGIVRILVSSEAVSDVPLLVSDATHIYSSVWPYPATNTLFNSTVQAPAFSGAGSALTGLSAANLTGTVAPANLGTGSGGSVKFLREDSTWQTVSTDTNSLASLLATNGNAYALTNLAGVGLDYRNIVMRDEFIGGATGGSGTVAAYGELGWLGNYSTGGNIQPNCDAASYNRWGGQVLRTGTTSNYFSGIALSARNSSTGNSSMHCAWNHAPWTAVFVFRIDSAAGGTAGTNNVCHSVGLLNRYYANAASHPAYSEDIGGIQASYNWKSNAVWRFNVSDGTHITWANSTITAQYGAYTTLTISCLTNKTVLFSIDGEAWVPITDANLVGTISLNTATVPHFCTFTETTAEKDMYVDFFGLWRGSAR